MRKLCAVCVFGALVGCSTSAVPMAPRQSPHFDPVAAKLQLGGTVFAYVDVDGDAVRAADFVASLLRSVPHATNEGATVNATRLVNAVGLGGVRAVGMSSYAKGELFHNRSFVYVTGTRDGILEVLGDQPRPFNLTRLAGLEADFVWEQQLDLPALVGVLRALGAEGVGPSPSAIDSALGRDLLGLDVTLGSVVAGLDTTIGLIVTLDDTRILRIPGNPVWFPFTDFLLQVDGVGGVVDALARRATFDPFIEAERSDQWLTIRPTIRLPPPWNAYRPALYKDARTGRVYVVSTPEYLERCLTAKATVVETDDYKQAFDGLPETGNGMIYMSRQLTRELHGIVDRQINEGGTTVATTIARFILPDAGSPVGWAVASRDDGVLFTSNSPSSHKATLVSLGYAAILPAIFVLAASTSAPSGPELPF